MNEIAFYGGTFDPPHFGHINMALQILERKKLKAIYFSPAFLPPHKMKNPPLASAQDRLEMTRLIVEEVPNLFVDDGESKREKISFTIDGLRNFQKKFPKEKIRWIIAEDSLDTLHEWKDIEEIFHIAPPYIGGRIMSYDCCHLPLQYGRLIKENFVSIKKMDVSSTDIRLRLKKGLYCGHLVPPKVLDYIRINDLYSL